MKSRRLVRDQERKPSHHEAFVFLAMIGFATRRLTKESFYSYSRYLPDRLLVLLCYKMSIS